MPQELGAASAPARVLLVEDDPRSAMLIGEMLRADWSQGLVIAHAAHFTDANRELLHHGATCVLLQLAAADEDPLAELEHLRSSAPDVPIIVLSREHEEDLGLAAVKAGAQDFLRVVELNPARLGRAVRFAIERKRTEVELAHQALHDPLTDLPNRTLFVDRVTVALDRSRRTGAPVAVMFLDVDQFKEINDSLGHSAGDRLLTTLAGRFRELSRPMDTVSRFGGDEFTFLFEELESEREAMLIAERIEESAGRPLDLGGVGAAQVSGADEPPVPSTSGETHLTVSIGIAIASDPEVSPDSLLRDADVAMYRAKELGGGRAELFDESSRIRASRRLEREAALRRALDQNELRLHYQPKVSLNGGTSLTGFEALVRWEHPEQGLLPAAEFVGLAEETGLIVPIGEWVLRQALDQVAGWRQSRPGVTVSVNISARQLEEPRLLTQLSAAAQAAGADPSVLCLELREDALQKDPEAVARTLASLRALGVKLALDDFGTGRSSLSSLRGLPLDTIKIHSSFLRSTGAEPAQEAMLGAMVELGHALGVRVIAEGVESDDQLAQIRQLGCDGAQGYLFSHPLPEAGVHELLAPE
jgi:predicted signal transduction protein with EAL and GGDEF domain